MVAGLEVKVFKGTDRDIIVIDAPHRTIEEHLSVEEQRRLEEIKLTKQIQSIALTEAQRSLGDRFPHMRVDEDELAGNQDPVETAEQYLALGKRPHALMSIVKDAFAAANLHLMGSYYQTLLAEAQERFFPPVREEKQA